MLTGSHNPPDYNSLKVTLANNILANQEILELIDFIKNGNYDNDDAKIVSKDVADEYVNYILERESLDKNLKIVIDAGNGIAGEIAPKLFKKT